MGRVNTEWCQLLGKLTPLPSLPLPPCGSQSVGTLQGGHINAVLIGTNDSQCCVYDNNFGVFMIW